MGFWLGVAFLVACGMGVVVFRKLAHAALLRKLDWRGATVQPVCWGLSGLRIHRERWEGEVEFEPGSIGGGGHRGHLRLIASLRRKTPTIALTEAGRRDVSGGEPAIQTGDPAFDATYAVKGDAEFARKILGPEQRERLLRLRESGGALWAVSGGVVEVVGPLLVDPAGLRQFLDQCDVILDAMARTVAA